MLGSQTKSGFNGAYRFLSNFYPSTIDFEDFRFTTVEHAYQAAKTLDPDIRKYIAQTPTAAEAKKIGRQIVLRPDWEEVKLPIMKRLLQKKFYDPILRNDLKLTDPTELIEYNYWHDNFWGRCQCLRETCNSTGENNLGKLLMEIREELLVRDNQANQNHQD